MHVIVTVCDTDNSEYIGPIVCYVYFEWSKHEKHKKQVKSGDILTEVDKKGVGGLEPLLLLPTFKKFRFFLKKGRQIDQFVR